MSVSGLPGSLELLLVTVLEIFTVKIWQIYEEREVGFHSKSSLLTT